MNRVKKVHIKVAYKRSLEYLSTYCNYTSKAYRYTSFIESAGKEEK